MDEKTARKLIAALDRNSDALESHEKLLRKVLGVSSVSKPKIEKIPERTPMQKVYGTR